MDQYNTIIIISEEKKNNLALTHSKWIFLSESNEEKQNVVID
jgi:hypothetical protein